MRTSSLQQVGFEAQVRVYGAGLRIYVVRRLWHNVVGISSGLEFRAWGLRCEDKFWFKVQGEAFGV